MAFCAQWAHDLHVFALILGEQRSHPLRHRTQHRHLVLRIDRQSVWLSRLGLLISVGWPSSHELGLMLVVGMAGILVGLSRLSHLPSFLGRRHDCSYLRPDIGIKALP
jgi:hypothetical protein